MIQLRYNYSERDTLDTIDVMSDYDVIGKIERMNHIWAYFRKGSFNYASSDLKKVEDWVKKNERG